MATTVKYVTTLHTPRLLLKIYFFIKYNNEWKERKLRRKKSQKKVTLTKAKK